MQSIETDSRDGGVDVLDFLRTLWAGRWLIVAITFFLTLAGVTYALLATQWFQADVTLAQVDTKSASSGLAQLGGLASLAGINISAGDESQTSVAVLKSRDFARAFIADNKLLPVLFSDKWDAQNGHWKNPDIRKQPDLRDAVTLFDETVRAVSQDKKTGLVTLSVTWKDPDISAQWANLLVAQINERLRQQALSEAEHNIAYLRDEMAATNITSLQQSIGNVLQSEMQKLLLAREREEFAFKLIDHATPPKYRSKPQRPIVVALSFMAGGALSVFLVLLRSSRSRMGKGGRSLAIDNSRDGG